jgi:hypothetical protein
VGRRFRLPIAKSKPWQAKPPAPPLILRSLAGTQSRYLPEAVRLKGEGIRSGSWKLNEAIGFFSQIAARGPNSMARFHGRASRKLSAISSQEESESVAAL